MTANKYEKVRAGIGWNDEIVELMKLHNNANILCIPARFVSLSEALNFVEIFLSTNFEGGRHQNRIDKIPLTC
jgi:ribose 5-phosphate isomerase B